MSTAARIEELRKKFEENPRRYFAPLANEHRKAGDLSQAIALCREFLPKQPGHMSGFIVFGQSLYEAGELEEARSVFEQALSLDPENLIALRHLGDIARASGDAASARRWYERVLDADPRNDDIAAQLSTLASVRPATPPSSPTPTFESIAARLSETPAVPMDSLGFTVMPTPDSVMRAVDFDGFDARFRGRTPIDLEAVDSGASAAPAAPPPAAPEIEATHVDAPEVEAIEADADEVEAVDAEAPRDDARETDAPEVVAGEFHDEDPWTFPDAEAETTSDAEADADAAANAERDAAIIEAEFEEGLNAANWPDTTELVARALTPRSVTPISVTPLSSSALDDAISAFGREPIQPAFDDRAEGLEPVVESEVAPDIEPVPAFEATSVEVEAPISLDAIADEPVSLDAITDEIEVPVGFEVTSEDVDSSDVFTAVTDEMQIPVAFETVSDEVESIASPDVVDEEAPWASAESSRDEEQVEEVAASALESTIEVAAKTPELPWLAVSDTTSEMLAEIEESEPGLEEIAGAFAEDARSAGDQGAVTVAALEDPLPSGEAESFADVAQEIDDEAATALKEEVEREVAESLAEVRGTPASGAPAFVTETMGELLVAQGFVARAVEVYDELVRRRPFDPVLSARLDELRAMTAPVERPTEDVAPVEAETPFTHATTSFEMFASPVMSDGFDVASPTPTYGTPVSATPVLGVSALTGQPYRTPAQPTPSFTQRVTPQLTPAVTPYAQPAPAEEFAPRRSAREWFAALASRRVPRRTPTQSASAVESSPEGLASLFGDASAEHDDAAARALADAFAPVSEHELESGTVLDFEFARATPMFSPTVATPANASVATPSHASTPSSFTPTASPPAASASGGNAGFSFDKFFPDPATRRGTPAAPSSAVNEAPVTDDLAQFSAWLKGLGNS